MIDAGAGEDEAYYPPQSPVRVGLAGRCPRCGRGPLFEGFLKIRSSCTSCGLDMRIADAGDGPAVFVIFITGFVGIVAALIARFGFDAPPWATLLIGLVIISGLTLALLRPMKATLFALQYRNKAAEGRLE